MGRGDNRHTPKMKQRKGRAKKKARERAVRQAAAQAATAVGAKRRKTAKK